MVVYLYGVEFVVVVNLFELFVVLSEVEFVVDVDVGDVGCGVEVCFGKDFGEEWY